jgi:hypothetical protein
MIHSPPFQWWAGQWRGLYNIIGLPTSPERTALSPRFTGLTLEGRSLVNEFFSFYNNRYRADHAGVFRLDDV